MAQPLSIAKIPTLTSHRTRSLGWAPGRGSDHRSFISNAYPAVRFMENHGCSPSPVDNSCGGPFPCPPPAQIPASCKETTFITTHQHSPNDQVQYITPLYAATVAQ